MRYDFLPHAYDPRLYHDPLRRPVLSFFLILVTIPIMAIGKAKEA